MSNKKSITSSSYVYECLMQKMHKGELLPGNSLDLKGIRQELSVSSTPLSNALIRMEAEGFVTIFPRSKVVVNKLQLKDFNLLYNVISALEFQLIATAFEAYTPTVIAKLRDLNAHMKEAIEQHRIQDYDIHHYEFHSIFTDCNKRIFATRILNPIKSRLWDFPRKNFLFHWYLQAVDEHEQIICAIEKHDEVALAHILKEVHWGYKVCKEFIKIEYNLEE